jgi:protein gp37
VTSIEWTEQTWNPSTGCDRISPGCDRCYALTMAKRLKGMGQAKYQNDGDPRTSGPGFGLTTHPDVLAEPLRWTKPRKVFVNSMSDLFHARVPREFLARVFAVMAMTPQHTYQVLSKRPTRMRDLLSSPDFEYEVAQQIDAVQVDMAHDHVERWAPIPGFRIYEASTHGRVRGANGVLATSLNPRNGRETVTLWNQGDQKTVPVHRLVLMAHTPSDDSSLEACHRNGDKTDNRLANLRWGTRSENQLEKTRHGSRGGPKKINAQVAAQIRKARSSGLTQQAVADRFGVSRPLVSLIENGKAWGGSGIQWPLPNVWLGTSVENQKYADLRIPALLETPAAVRFLSCEPLLGPVRLTRGHAHCPTHDFPGGFCSGPCPDLILPDWIIIGGESGPGARPFDPQWAADLIDDARLAGSAPFVKQLGSVWARDITVNGKTVAAHGDTKGGKPEYWPANLRVREYPKQVATDA